MSPTLNRRGFLQLIGGTVASAMLPRNGASAIVAPDSVETDYGYHNRQLPQQLVEAITEIIKEAQLQDRWNRLQELLRASLCRYYDKGLQHLWCDGQTWNQAFAGQSYINGYGQTDSFPDYVGDYNIFTAFAQIRQAKISEPDIGIDFQPIRPDRSEDRLAAQAANAIKMQADIDRDPHEIMTEKIYYLDMDGAAVTYTYTTDADEEFGGDEGPRRVICREVGGVLEWKRPLFANSLKECWYMIRYKDPDIKVAKSKYDWIASQLEAGQVCLNETAYERIQRLSMSQSLQARRFGWDAGDTITHLITEGDIWLRPCAWVEKTQPFKNRDGEFEYVDDQDRNGNQISRPKTVSEKLTELYPLGGHFVYAGQSYAESWAQSMDRCLSLCHEYVGKGQARKPGMYEIVLVQDRFNQTLNYIAENNDFGAPATWVNSRYCDYPAISKQGSRPGAFHELKNLPGGAKAADMIYREAPVGIPPGFLDFAADFLMGALSQFQLAAPPSIWGAPEKGNDTAEGLRLAASQALGILGKLRTRIINSDAQDYVNACIAVSEDEKYPDKMTIPMAGSKGRTAVIQKGALSAGRFRAYPDKDSGFPESVGSQRQAYERFAGLIAPTPIAMEFFTSPKNLAMYVDKMGLDLEIPSAKSWDKQSREIEVLLADRPVLNDPALATLLDTLGTTVQTMLDAIKQTVQQAQQRQLAIAQAAWNSPENPAMVQHAAAALAWETTGKAAGLPEPPMPVMPPPPPFDPFAIARSSVRVIDSDFHDHEAAAAIDWLSGDECEAELDVDDIGVNPPNVAGVLNITLHAMEHLAKKPEQWQVSMTGPLPAVGSPPKQPPMVAGA